MSDHALTAAELEAALSALPPVEGKDRSRSRRRHLDRRAVRRRISDGRSRDRLPRGFGQHCEDPDVEPGRWGEWIYETNPEFCTIHYANCGKRLNQPGYWRKRRLPGCLWCDNSCPDYTYIRVRDKTSARYDIEAGLADWQDSRTEPWLAEAAAHHGRSRELHTRSWDSYC